MDFKYLLVSKAEGIGWVRFNRPPVNALNTALVLELEQAVDAFAAQDDVLVIVLTGEGKAFVAGADIAEMSGFTPLQARVFAQNGHRALGKLAQVEKPVIAAVNGFALGGGCEIALACDIRVLADTAKIGQPEVNLGLIPGFGGTQRLARLVGKGIAQQLVLTGDMITAAEAHRIGLVNEVVPQPELIARAEAIAQKIVANAPLAVRATKEVLNASRQIPVSEGMSLAKHKNMVLMLSQDIKEAFVAFMEKRKPDFKGKGFFRNRSLKGPVQLNG